MQLMNSTAVATAPAVMASLTTLPLSLLLAPEIRAPDKAPPIIAFFCRAIRAEGTGIKNGHQKMTQNMGGILGWKCGTGLTGHRSNDFHDAAVAGYWFQTTAKSGIFILM
jgi:hypothetical protein